MEAGLTGSGNAGAADRISLMRWLARGQTVVGDCVLRG